MESACSPDAISRTATIPFAVAGAISLFIIGKVLGHKQARTTERYAYLRDDPVLAVAEGTASKDRSGDAK
jgi:hypothetical protein